MFLGVQNYAHSIVLRLGLDLTMHALCHACLGVLETKYCNSAFLTFKLHVTSFIYTFRSLHLSIILHVKFVFKMCLLQAKTSKLVIMNLESSRIVIKLYDIFACRLKVR